MDLTKMFVLVPSTSAATVEAIKTASLSSNKIYFMAKYNQIVAKGAVYGVDPSTGKELETLVGVLGGTKADDGTVSVDFSGLNYYASEGTKTIIGAIKALDAKVKEEMDKLAASKTLNEKYEFTGKLKYVAAVKDGEPAHIAIADETGAEILGTSINVSDIIGNGVLKSSAYDAATGILTLTFAQADAVDKAIQVDLKAMLDINDISIAEASKNYLEVTLGTASTEGDTQAVFGAKIVKVAEASDAKTGLVDAKDAKDYVDKTVDAAIKALDVPAIEKGNNVKVTISETDGKVSLDSVSESYAEVNYTAHDETHNTSISVAQDDETKLIKASDLVKVAGYAAGKVTEEAARVDAKIAALAGDKSGAAAGVSTQVTTAAGEVSSVVVSVADNAVTSAGAKGSRTLSVDSTDNVIKGNAIAAIKDYVDNVVSDNTADLTVDAAGDDYITAAVDAVNNKKIKVTADVTKLTVTTSADVDSTLTGTAKSLADAGDVAEKVSAFVNARIAEEIKKLDVAPAEVSEAGEGAIKFTYSETDGKVAISNLSATYASHSSDTHTLSTGIVNGTVLNSVLADMWETYVDA